ncbi:hypothetical protein ED733_003528 [Metarhizium rileyi]|uniref:FAD/NAD(P)-binding domain-containing protein n=1 Tax=Metarhizium rileyi (strain RCEF 4871) TaxID=1649241 RepID=A0A5C6GA59_METRR|nr:hypothetical protein ED733_003528 [Metarhizium rileyi]
MLPRCTTLGRLRARSTAPTTNLRLPQPIAPPSSAVAHYSSAPPPVAVASSKHRVVVVGAGAAGLSVSHQLLRSGKYVQDDIAVVDPATWHHYQPGWTLVAAGLKRKDELKMATKDIVDAKLKFYNQGVSVFTPKDNSVTLTTGDKVQYEHLVVCPGIRINYDSIKGLPEALADPESLISTTYSYETCDKVFRNIKRMDKGNAIFTQPTGIIKCAGAPQKAMWLALDYWRRAGLYQPDAPLGSGIKISFATGLPVMFGVPRYSQVLDRLRQERRVSGLFEHDLVAIDGNEATFALPGDKRSKLKFDFLHVVPKMGPHSFVANSPLADATGLVDVDRGTMQHRKYNNVWSIGDASNLPTSKTAAAITAQAPVLVSNLLGVSEAGRPLLLAEFKYGGEVKETFGRLVDQSVPARGFYYLKRDFFPWVYKRFMVKGAWGGPRGFIRQGRN